jgi:uncharacterized protein (DUF1697 family)
MARLIALLRGINVGRNKRIGMADLRESLHALEFDDVKTILQSGNVVFTASERPGTVARRIEDRLRQDAGIHVDVLIRTRDELAKIVARDPLREHVTDPKRYLVVFLSAKPDPNLLGEIDEDEVEPDLFRAHGSEIYVWLPEGMQGARLTHAFWEKRLRITATGRNWNTVERLLAAADA